MIQRHRDLVWWYISSQQLVTNLFLKEPQKPKRLWVSFSPPDNKSVWWHGYFTASPTDQRGLRIRCQCITTHCSHFTTSPLQSNAVQHNGSALRGNRFSIFTNVWFFYSVCGDLWSAAHILFLLHLFLNVPLNKTVHYENPKCQKDQLNVTEVNKRVELPINLKHANIF